MNKVETYNRKNILSQIKWLVKMVRYLLGKETSEGGSGIQSIQEGDNISIDNTDPQNPVVSSTGELQDLQSVLDEGGNAVVNKAITLMAVSSDTWNQVLNITSDSLAVKQRIFQINSRNNGYLFLDNGVATEYGGNYYSSYFGAFALYSLPSENAISAKDNTAYGPYSMYALTTGLNNVGVGNGAGRHLMSGNNNTFLGMTSGNRVVGGNANTIIGRYQFPINTTINNNIVISDGTTGANSVGFRVTEDGLTTVPRQTITTIDNDTTGKAVITKEYFEANSGGSTPTLSEVLAEGNIADTGQGITLNTATFMSKSPFGDLIISPVGMGKYDTVSSDMTKGFQFSIVDESFEGILVYDLVDSKGLVGEYYYGANYDNNTYVQKKYVDDNTMINPTLITGYDAGETQTLKNVNGVLTWVTD